MKSSSNSKKLDSRLFLAKLISQYAHIHQKTAGPVANEYIRQLGIRTGEWFENFYDYIPEPWTLDDYANVIIDIKNSIGGHFEIDEIHTDHVIVKATECPFGKEVQQAPHLCMMTSSVFGGIAARKFGYAKVKLQKQIALGDSGCEVVIYFEPNEEVEGEVYEDLPITPEKGDPFTWEEDALIMLDKELNHSDRMIEQLLDELEDLRNEVNRLKKHV
ncbi:methanogen output domain 1-containing protein [Thalassobacillus pellis]|uniref:methanogen output domain 1-containing protein n=1 Tax=Thalassobacillus pellis TaxID=748008 RepID=UPI0019606670|nr:methanogen output domain 1-containing protein [Thalassobacillus pellis]MBM7551931.1 two-component system response regulator HydG [Thalassobacillus pellis]